MTARTAARLDKVETSLTPTQLVVRWLDEAHAFGGLEAYVAALLDGPPEEFPLNRLLWAASNGVRASHPRLPDPELEALRRRALRETTFRFELVMAINITTHDFLSREGLIHGFLAAHFALLTTEQPTTETARMAYLDRLGQVLHLAGQRVVELLAAQEARKIVEARYLAGHPALFPDDAAAFLEQLHETERQAVLGLRLAELDGLPPGEAGPPDAIERRAAQLVEDLVEPARTTALEKLDEDRQAIRIAAAWLRTRAERARAAAPEIPTL